MMIQEIDKDQAPLMSDQSNKVAELVVDKLNNTLILFYPTYMSHYDLNNKQIVAKTSFISTNHKENYEKNQNGKGNVNQVNQNRIIPLPENNLRFIQSQTQSHLHISLSGLTITCQTKDEEIAIANQGYEHGVHYWEWIFPKSCSNIQVGVIRKGWSLTNITINNKLSELFQFKTTTPRVLGFRLDLNRGEIKCWLNGVFQPQRIKKIDKGIWYPMVKLKEIGTQIILNPYGIDPERPEIIYENMSYSQISKFALKSNLAYWMLINTTKNLSLAEMPNFLKDTFGLANSDNDTINKTFKEYIFDENEQVLAIKSFNPSQIDGFYEQLKDKKLIVVENIKLKEWISNPETDIRKSIKDEFQNLYSWFHKNIHKLMMTSSEIIEEEKLKDIDIKKLTDKIDSLKSHFAQIKVNQLIEKNEELSSEFSTYYIKASDTLLITENNLIKLISRSQSGSFNFNPNLFGNRPMHPGDIITILIARLNLIQLLENIDISSNLKHLFGQNQKEFQAFDHFISSILNAKFDADNDSIIIKISYKHMKRVVDRLVMVLLQSLKWTENFVKNTTKILKSNIIQINNYEKNLKLKKAGHTGNESEPARNGINNQINEEDYDEANDSLPFFNQELDSKAKTIIAPVKVPIQNLTLKSPGTTEFHPSDPNSFIFRHLSSNSIYNMLHLLLCIDEELFAMIQHEQASPKFYKKIWQNKNPRMYSAFQRLQSFFSYPRDTSKHNPIELAQNGLYNTGDLIQDIRHYLDPEKKFGDIQNLSIQNNLWEFLNESLPHNRMIQGLPSTNIPLEITLNALPPQFHHQSTISEIALSKETSVISTVSQDGEARLWNTELALVNIAKTNFRLPFRQEEIYLFNKKKTSIDNTVSENLLRLNETIKGDNSKIQQLHDSAMLEKLYDMGFPLEIAIKALIKCKNQSIESALEDILQIQSESQTNCNKKHISKSKSKVITTTLKIEWECDACYSTNSSESLFCLVCGKNAPLNAFEGQNETIKEVIIGNLDDENNIQIEENAKPKEFFQDAKIKTSFLVDLKLSPLTPVILGLGFSDPEDGKSIVRLRRFVINPNYVKRFIIEEQSTTTNKGLFSLINSEWFSGKSFIDIQNHLVNECHLPFMILEPFYIGNYRYKDINTHGKDRLFSSDWIVMEEHDIALDIPCEILGSFNNRISYDYGNQEEVIGIYVLIREIQTNHVYLYTYILTNVCLNPFDLKIQRTFSIDYKGKIQLANVKHNEFLNIMQSSQENDSLNNNLYIVCKTSITQVKFGKESDSSIPNQLQANVVYNTTKFEIKKIKLIDFERKFLVIDNNGILREIDLNDQKKIVEIEGVDKKSEEASINSKAQINQVNKKMPQVTDLSNEDIEGIRMLLKKKPAETTIDIKKFRPDIIACCSTTNNKYSKYYIPLRNITKVEECQHTEKNIEFELRFDGSQSIMNIELNLELENTKRTTSSILTNEKEKEFYEKVGQVIFDGKNAYNTTGSSINEKTTNVEANAPKSQDFKAFSLSSTPDLSGEISTVSKGAFLPLRVISFKGAQLNEKYSVNRLIANNNDIFCANYPESEFIFEHMHEKHMIIDSVTIKSAVKPCQVNSGYPIGTGLIFASNNIAHLFRTEEFNGFTYESYLAWLQGKPNKEIKPWEPIGAFQFDASNEIVIVELNNKQPWKYILLKPTGMRKTPENFTAYFKNSPIEIKFFGLTGTALDDQLESSPLNYKIKADLTLPTKITENIGVEIEANIGSIGKPKWIKAYSIDKLPINFLNLIDDIQVIPEYYHLLESIPFISSSTTLNISNEFLANSKIIGIRVKLIQDYASVYLTSGISISIYVSNEYNLNKSLKEYYGNMQSIILDPKHFDKFNNQLVKELSVENVDKNDIERRKKISNLLSDLIIHEKNLIYKIYEVIDLEQYIILNVLRERNPTFFEVFNLMKNFAAEIDLFPNDLLKTLLNILPNLSEINGLTIVGLNGFFNLLSWCYMQNSEISFIKLLNELRHIVKKIKEIRLPEYNILRLQYGISSPVFDREIFSETNILACNSIDKVATNKTLTGTKATGSTTDITTKKLTKELPISPSKLELMNNSSTSNSSINKFLYMTACSRQTTKAIKCKILAYQSQDIDDYLIDLNKTHKIKEIRFFTESNDKAIKFRVQIWGFNPSNGQRIFMYSKYYNEDIWMQMSNNAYQEQSGLGITEFDPISIRYLHIQITYTLIPGILTQGIKMEKKIIPEIFGTSEGIENIPVVNDSKNIIISQTTGNPKSPLKELNSLFNSFDPKQLNQIENYTYKSLFGLKYEKYELPSSSSLPSALHYKILFNATPPSISSSKKIQDSSSSGTIAINHVNENEEFLIDNLRNYQADLSTKLYSSRNIESFMQNKQDIYDLCDEIEKAQINLYSLQTSKPTYSLGSYSKSLDFFYTYAIRISIFFNKFNQATKIISAIQSQNDQQKINLQETFLEIFETLIVYESAPYSNEFLNLLRDNILPLLKSEEVPQIFIKIIDEYLSKPISIATSAPSQLFSHGKVIEALEEFPLPLNSILEYLVKSLKIPLGPVENIQDEIVNPHVTCTLASVFLLINKGYKSSKKNSNANQTQISDDHSLKVIYYTTVWICRQSGFNDIDKTSLVSLALDLILEALQFCTLNTLKDLIQDSESFICTYMTIMMLNHASLTTRYKNLLIILLDPKSKCKSDNISGINYTLLADEIKILLIQSLHKILKMLLKYPDELDIQNIDTKQIVEPSMNLNSGKIKSFGSHILLPKLWIDMASFLIDFLLLAVDKIDIQTVVKKDSNSGSKHGKGVNFPMKKTDRKKSLQSALHPGQIPIVLDEESQGIAINANANIESSSIQPKPNEEIAIDNFEKSLIIPISLIVLAIKRLSPSKSDNKNFGTSYSFSASSSSWSLVMKAILKCKIISLIEAKVFDELIDAFLTSSDDIQQIIFPELLQLTEHMATHPDYQKELCNAILSVVFNTLNYDNPIAFSLLKGWLDILLTQYTPKPNDWHFTSSNLAQLNCFCKLNARGALELLEGSASYLRKNLNLGGRDGVMSASERIIVKLQIADDLLKLLISSKSNSNLFSIEELFTNSKNHLTEMHMAIDNLIQWFLLNRTTDNGISPSTDLIKSISDSLTRLFSIMSEYPEIVKLGLKCLINASKTIDEKILKLQSSSLICAYTALQINNRVCKIMEELFESWVTTDDIASYIVFELKGFEYLLDRMGVLNTSGQIENSTETIEKPLTAKASLLEGTDLLEYVHAVTSVDGSTNIKNKKTDMNTTLTESIGDDPKEEEFANKVSLVNLPGQSWSGITPDWSINKKGARSRILFFCMAGQFYNEYCLLIRLATTIELKQIRIGFTSVWTDYSDKVLGLPSLVLVEGGTSPTNLTPIGTLNPVNDEGYSNFSVKVYQKNFQCITENNQYTIESALDSLQNKQISYLKLRCRRPIITFSENMSMLTGKQYKNIAVSISFLSIIGYDLNKLPNVRKKILDQQETSALQVIGKLCNPQFLETLSGIANQELILNKIKGAFDTLSSLLIPHESWLAPIFLAISSRSIQMGDWLLNKFMDISKSREHAKLISEIILNHTEYTYSRLLQFNNFIITELKKLLNLSSKLEAMNKFKLLVPFIEIFCQTMRTLPNDLITLHEEDPLNMSLSKENINAIIDAFEAFNTSDTINNKVLIKLILLYLYLPKPFKSTESAILTYTLEKIWSQIQTEGKTLYGEMLGPIVLGSKLATKWFLPHLDSVLQDLVAKLHSNSLPSKAVRHSFIFLNSIARKDSIKKKLMDENWHITFYELLKIQEKQSNSRSGNLSAKNQPILRDFDQEILQLAVDFIKTISIGFEKTEESMAKILIDDLTLLETKRDLAYVNNLLVPLLKAESDIPICLHPYDSQSRRIIADGKKLTINTKSSEMNAHEFFKSKLLNQEQHETIHKMIKQFATPTGLYRKMTHLPWELVLSSQNDGDNLLNEVRNKMSKIGPFLIIIEGMNAGKHCVTGAFSSQPIPELPAQWNTSYDQNYPVPTADDDFIFYYEDDFSLHFPQAFTNQTQFAQIHSFYDGGGGISFLYHNSERIFLSFTSSQSTNVDINLYDMKPLEEGQKSYPADIPVEFVFKSFECWLLKPNLTGSQISSAKDKIKQQGILNNVLYPQWYNQNQPLNYFRANPVYNVPCLITISKLTEIVLNSSDISVQLTSTEEKLKQESLVSELYEFVQKNSGFDNILDIQFDAHTYLEKSKSGQSQSEIDSNAKSGIVKTDDAKYKPYMTVYDEFEKQGGVEKIIDVTLKSLSLWKDKERAKGWLTWVQELSSFAALPNFFALFIKNKECVNLFFQILAGVPDEEKKNIDNKLWEEKERQAVKFAYQILADVFKVNNDVKVRELALEKQFVDRILDRVASISKETKRKYVEDIKSINTEDESKSPSPNKGNSESSDLKKPQKKKGVGYGSDATGQNQKWNVNEYVENKKVKTEQIINLLNIFYHFIDINTWSPPKKVYEIICESALLPLLEAAFRSGSLLDMGKEAELYTLQLKLVRAMAQHKILIKCIMDLDPHYQPKQTESIFTLLRNLKDLAQIFINCLKNTPENTTNTPNKEVTMTNQKLAEEIIEAYKYVEAQIDLLGEQDDENDDHAIQDILSQPLSIAYRALLKDLRFDYMNMRDDNGKYKHHYSSLISSTYTPPQAKMVRLAQELADLSTALPIEHTNSIFVRVDQNRVDVMKALIMGSSNTPYAHGAFEYDIYFDDSYPNNPPKVNLETTGSGKVRFNPNLYSCGKVCLSLLGTWRGNASENWDPKLSTLLQVLVSIQAIIMSDDVYFNEPGFEGEAGTAEGERKNEAYSNIVRYGNIKFAIVDQIRNPSKGFENVIRRHFYLKKDEILEECHNWIKLSETKEASYVGLVNDHNYSWCTEFKSSKTKYHDMLVETVKDLENELKKLAPPSIRDIQQKHTKKKKPTNENKAEGTKSAGIANIEEIDVTYDKDTNVVKSLDINEAGVKDRWSRYIGAMGIDAVAKQANSSIFLSGIGALGIEIAKNIVLSGVKRFVIHDVKKTDYHDLSGQFFLTEDDIGKNRALASLNKIQQLNYYVKVEALHLDKSLSLTIDELEKDLKLKEYNIVILAENYDYETQINIGNYCHKNNIHFISTSIAGPFARAFCDFGSKFTVLDKNGEELQEVMIKNITNEEHGVVTLLDGLKHKYEDGDEIILTGVDGMLTEDGKGSINNTKHKIIVINANSFKIGDTRKYTPYARNGLAKQQKTPIQLSFKPFEEAVKSKELLIDNNMAMTDFLKLNHPFILHIAFETLSLFMVKHKRLPHPWNSDDCTEFLKIAKESDAENRLSSYKSSEDKNYINIMTQFCHTCTGVFSPLAAFMGGYVAQEAIKAITQKFMPTCQFFYMDCNEIIPDEPIKQFKEINHRSDGLRICIGDKLLKELAMAKLFMVGAGAIGCELLKNYAMLGIGTGENGLITLTDPDVIETSNLNRQFLFREKHLRKPKSQTAAAAVLQMNKELKGHIVARLDKVHEGTAHIFTDKFFENLTVVTNALDNVMARRYVDLRCVTSKTALLESGTLGPKGHVQVIIPYKTESYSSQQDPQEESEIPHCTLKMFPEETLHCVEWARDKFGKLFTQRPKALNKILDDPNFKPASSQEIKTLREGLTLLKKRPTNFDDCIRYARIKFQKYFVNDIRQLLFTYPLDAKTKQGAPFWSLPKRPPFEINFDPNDVLHANFITACACLRANLFNIPIPSDVKTEAGKLELAQQAAKVKVIDFKPSSEKAKELASEVDKDQANKDKQQEEENKEEEEIVKLDEVESLLKGLAEEIKTLPKNKEGKVLGLLPEEFEKDNDMNFHIDFIHSIANCRSKNYKLEPMDWITVKLKAGKIIPALATTTASIAGLQVIELCKLLKNCKIEDMKNAFLNLAVPILALSEPGPAPKTKLSDKLIVSIWDRWEIKLGSNITLKKLFEKIEKKYELIPKDVMYGSQAIYFHAIMNIPGKEKEKENLLNQKITDLVPIQADDTYIDLNVTMSLKNGGDILKGVPPIRINFQCEAMCIKTYHILAEKNNF